METVDPFFYVPNDHEWNACIGQQGDEYNYADGYMEAAIELATLVIEKKLYGKRDTLILPILYNARHAIELNLKLVIGKLYRAGILAEEHKKNHDIKSHLDFLIANKIPDALVRECVKKLAPFVDSLSQIDRDGQEFRFHENRAGEPSMGGQNLANIALIRLSLIDLQEVINGLQDSTILLCEQRRVAAKTGYCSRRDLMNIANMLPPKTEWGGDHFTACKDTIRKQYCLSEREFNIALQEIKKTRELAGIVGIETKLKYLSDAKAEFLLAEWDGFHPIEARPATGGGIVPVIFDAEKMVKELETQGLMVSNIIDCMSADEFADAVTIYNLSRGEIYTEAYEEKLVQKQREFKVREDFPQVISDLLDKTNFDRHFIQGLRKVGRLRLAEMLESRHN